MHAHVDSNAVFVLEEHTFSDSKKSHGTITHVKQDTSMSHTPKSYVNEVKLGGISLPREVKFLPILLLIT